MATKLPQDFKEFLKLLNEFNVEYLLIGGYAVAHYGYPRPTADFDIWIAMNRIFAECFGRRIVVNLDGVNTNLISLDDLKQNKRASGRAKDLNDLEHLPDS